MFLIKTQNPQTAYSYGLGVLMFKFICFLLLFPAYKNQPAFCRFIVTECPLCQQPVPGEAPPHDCEKNQETGKQFLLCHNFSVSFG